MAGDQLRNVALVGPPLAGTSQVLATALAIAPNVSHVRVGSLDIGSLEWRDHAITFLDPDGANETRTALSAVDAACFVISAAHGVDADTIRLWEYCTVLRLPRCVVVTHLDDERADFDEAVAICRRVFDPQVIRLHVPVLDDDDSLGGLIDLTDMHVHDFTSGQRHTRAADDEHWALLADQRSELLDAIPSGLAAAVRELSIYPVLVCAHNHRTVGVEDFLDFVIDALPSPAERQLPTVHGIDGAARAPLTPSADGPLCGEIVSTDSEDLGVVRIFSGTLRAQQPVVLTRPSGEASPGTSIAHALQVGNTSQPAISAGWIALASGLESGSMGDTISDPADPLVLTASPQPIPVASFQESTGISSVTVTISAPREFTPSLEADLARRRASLVESTTEPGGQCVIVAELPLGAAAEYPIDAYVLTDGTASVSWVVPTPRPRDPGSERATAE